MRACDVINRAVAMRNASIKSTGEQCNRDRANTRLGPFVEKIIANLPGKEVICKKVPKFDEKTKQVEWVDPGKGLPKPLRCSMPMNAEKKARLRKKVGLK